MLLQGFVLATPTEKQATIYGFEMDSLELFCLFQILMELWLLAILKIAPSV